MRDLLERRKDLRLVLMSARKPRDHELSGSEMRPPFKWTPSNAISKARKEMRDFNSMCQVPQR